MRDAGKQNKYKTKLCQKYWIAGYCAYGPRCNFLHNEEGETQVKQINSIEDNIGESFELPSPSLSSSTARGMVRIPPLSSLLWPQYGSGRLAAFPHNDGLAWVDTRTNTIVWFTKPKSLSNIKLNNVTIIKELFCKRYCIIDESLFDILNFFLPFL